MQGADIHTVAQVLGRKHLRMAARYQHLSPSFLADAVARLGTVFDSPSPQRPPSAKAYRSGSSKYLITFGVAITDVFEHLAATIGSNAAPRIVCRRSGGLGGILSKQEFSHAEV